MTNIEELQKACKDTADSAVELLKKSSRERREEDDNK